MGKNVVITGVSFKKYAIGNDVIINELDYCRVNNIAVSYTANVSASSFVIDRVFNSGEKCNAIEILPKSAGTLTIGRGNRTNGFTIVESRTLNVQLDKTIYEFDEIEFDDGDLFFIMLPTDTGNFKYHGNGKVLYGFSYPVRVGSSVPAAQQGMSLCYNLLYFN